MNFNNIISYVREKEEVKKMLNLPIFQCVWDLDDKRYFTLMKKASGILFSEIIKNLIKKPFEYSSLLKRATSELGRSLAVLHKNGEFIEFSSKLSHEDIHGGNIFYDNDVGITFIDNENIPVYEHRNIDKDLIGVFIFTLCVPLTFTNSEIISLEAKNILIESVKIFIDSYSSNMPHSDQIRKMVTEISRKTFAGEYNNCQTYWTIGALIFNDVNYLRW